MWFRFEVVRYRLAWQVIASAPPKISLRMSGAGCLAMIVSPQVIGRSPSHRVQHVEILNATV